MRSSFRKDDPGYKTRTLGVVTVDGVPVKKCFTADEELGEAWCYVTNESGAVVKAPGGKSLLEICHRGKVVITPHKHLSPAPHEKGGITPEDLEALKRQWRISP